MEIADRVDFAGPGDGDSITGPGPRGFSGPIGDCGQETQ